jgi:hypothetical protein
LGSRFTASLRLPMQLLNGWAGAELSGDQAAAVPSSCGIGHALRERPKTGRTAFPGGANRLNCLAGGHGSACRLPSPPCVIDLPMRSPRLQRERCAGDEELQ